MEERHDIEGSVFPCAVLIKDKWNFLYNQKAEDDFQEVCNSAVNWYQNLIQNVCDFQFLVQVSKWWLVKHKNRTTFTACNILFGWHDRIKRNSPQNQRHFKLCYRGGQVFYLLHYLRQQWCTLWRLSFLTYQILYNK